MVYFWVEGAEGHIVKITNETINALLRDCSCCPLIDALLRLLQVRMSSKSTALTWEVIPTTNTTKCFGLILTVEAPVSICSWSHQMRWSPPPPFLETSWHDSILHYWRCGSACEAVLIPVIVECFLNLVQAIYCQNINCQNPATDTFYIHYDSKGSLVLPIIDPAWTF